MKIFFYKNAKSPVLEFIKALDIQERAKILACLKSIEVLSFHSPRVDFRQIKGKLWEIKIRASMSNYRIFYFTLKKEMIVLLHVYKKKSQKAPKKEIKIAEKRMEEVEKNENDYINRCD